MSSDAILLIQTGSAPETLNAREGDLPQWFARALGRDLARGMQVVRVFAGETLPPPGQHALAIITGSAAMVTDREAWSEATAVWIRQAMAVSMPLFGVCYGHQLMADALGGTVGDHPEGGEAGCLEIELLSEAGEDPLLAGLPSRFTAHLTHSQSVLVPPRGARVLARSRLDPHQVLRYGPVAVSTQFHPEFVPEITAAFLPRREAMLRAQGVDLQSCIDGLVDAPVGRAVLQRFTAWHMGRDRRGRPDA